MRLEIVAVVVRFFPENVDRYRARADASWSLAGDDPRRCQLAIAVAGCTVKNAINYRIASGALRALGSMIAPFRIKSWGEGSATQQCDRRDDGPSRHSAASS